MNSGTLHDFPPIYLYIFYNFIGKFYLILFDMSMILMIFFYYNNNLSFQIKKETRTIAFRTSLLFQLKCMLPPFLNSG
ncbi:hypothetical protein CLOSTHATH_05057 [Hungatella hathewayi DSM 13479]|uniref:Uncharacterized protein n=1 Tax=Hungatella hathewayi DSM 13479 TaxID=566550 RepID=D3AN58_9FIRM|nr:hypothetical protein CLOSTHATH_05057 [Hungatella hathewayi DSM 13479]